MTQIISADWGTSNLRLRLVDLATESVLAEVAEKEGIAGVFKAWEKSRLKNTQRVAFFQSRLQHALLALRDKFNAETQGLTLVLSGMSSSNIGMHPLPYKELPFQMDGSDLIMETLPESGEFAHRVLLISGVKTTEDVMRGEETQLVGCLDDRQSDERQLKPGGTQLYLLPGTHSKHLVVKGGQATGFKTYMTGELFSLLSKDSILAASIATPDSATFNADAFEEGVSDSLSENLLAAAFRVRVNQLFERRRPEENYDYLSGLVIGSEVKDLPGTTDSITLVGTEDQMKRYAGALAVLGNKDIRCLDSSTAIVKGHCRILRAHGFPAT